MGKHHKGKHHKDKSKAHARQVREALGGVEYPIFMSPQVPKGIVVRPDQPRRLAASDAVQQAIENDRLLDILHDEYGLTDSELAGMSEAQLAEAKVFVQDQDHFGRVRIRISDGYGF